MNLLDAFLRKHRLCDIGTHKLLIKVCEIKARLNVWLERRFNLLVEKFLTVNIFKEWMPKDLFNVIFLTQSLFAVLFKESCDEILRLL
jgi:hypothetical protein